MKNICVYPELHHELSTRDGNAIFLEKYDFFFNLKTYFITGLQNVSKEIIDKIREVNCISNFHIIDIEI